MTQDDVPLILIAGTAAGTALAAAGLWLVKKLISKVESTFHVKVPAELVTALQKFPAMGAAYAEERFRQWVQGQVKDGPKTGQEKLALAVTTARELAPDGLQQFSDKQVQLAVEAALPELRARVSAAPPPERGAKSLPPLGAPPIPSDATTLASDIDTAPATPSAIKKGGA